MSDAFESTVSSLDAPISAAVAVTPNDGADLAVISRALYIGGGGDLRVTLKAGTAPVTFTAMAAGWHPIRARRVHAAGTTATDIVAGW